MRVGIDVGGTFTDLVACDSETGQLFLFKCLTTSDDLSQCFMAALRFASLRGPGEELTVIHGTTVATNALLQEGDHSVGTIRGSACEG